MKFAHMGDCHLGGWSQQELRNLNFKSFQSAIDRCIKEKVEFILITGDLFDTAYPSIDVLKETFQEFKRIKDVGIPVFLIAGSHDYSVSGKTFLEVLEKAGFCRNASIAEERNGSIVLHPIIYKEAALYGYPGKKSGLEVEEIGRIKLDDSPGFFKILMLHTAIRDAVGSLPIDAVDHNLLPKVDYIALSHLHINYQKANRVYSGPIFPANISELEELQGGSFYIYDHGKIRREEIKLKGVVVLSINLSNTYQVDEKVIKISENEAIHDKLVILKISGVLEQGKIGDIDFSKIESLLRKKGAYAVLKTTSKLYSMEGDSLAQTIPTESLEPEIIQKFMESNPSKFNYLVPQLMRALHLEKQEDERSAVFEERVFSESRKILGL